MNNEEIICLLQTTQPDFHPVVPFDPAKDKLLLLDFTENNKALTDDLFDNTRNFIEFINWQLIGKHARYGIGGYGEHRTIYSRSKVFDAEKPGEEPRRLHLGMDIWSKPYTPVICPLNGIVHSFAFNNGAGNYGTTIILSHSFKGAHFHTLYGHLTLNSIKNMQEGERVERGDVFAEFGIPVENGHWPPHLHFQIIIDLEGWKGDYPGVCKYSEKEKYLANCPDPDLILRMNRYL
jgi:peptidoglycan LD-endopeptidase LytH